MERIEAFVNAIPSDVSYITRNLTILLLLILAGVGYKKGRSGWSLSEMLLLAFVMYFGVPESPSFFLQPDWASTPRAQLRTGFPTLLLGKLVVSFVVFFYELWRYPAKRRFPQLGYTTWFKRDPFHAGITVGTKFYHYAFPDHRGKAELKESATEEDLDSVHFLRPSVRDAIPPANINTKVGFAQPNLDENDVKKKLELSGKCHDWSGVLLYTISTDKFMSYGLVAWLRWLNWIWAGVGFFVLMFSGPLGRSLLELLLVASTLLDIVNVPHGSLEGNKSRAQRALKLPMRSNPVEVFKFVVQFSILFASHFLFHRYFAYIEFYEFLFFSMALSQVVSLIVTSTHVKV